MAKTRYVTTVKQIENLKPRDDRYEIADSVLRKNRIVVFPSGAKSWVFRYRFGGRTRKLTLECGATDLARARELGSEAMKALAAGRDPGAEKQEKKAAGSPLTVEQLVDKYVEAHLNNLRRGAEIERILRKELKPFYNRLADGGISEFEASKLIAAVTERGTVMGNRTLAACKGLFTFAKSSKVKAASSNPFAELKLEDEGDGRERVLSKVEIKAVWKAADKLGPAYRDVVHLLLLTGQRLREIGDLRWNEIDFDKRQIELPSTRTKNGMPHIIPLSDSAVAIIEAAPKIKSDENLVFTLGGGKLNGFSKMRRRLTEAVAEALGAEPDHWTIHDIRRTMTTRMAEDLKIGPHIIDKILNHSSGVIRGVARVYNRSELLDERRAALEAWGRYLGGLVNSAPSNVVQLRGSS